VRLATTITIHALIVASTSLYTEQREATARASKSANPDALAAWAKRCGVARYEIERALRDGRPA